MPSKNQLKALALRCSPAYHAWAEGLVDTDLARKLRLRTTSDVIAFALGEFARKAKADPSPDRANPSGIHRRDTKGA